MNSIRFSHRSTTLELSGLEVQHLYAIHKRSVVFNEGEMSGVLIQVVVPVSVILELDDESVGLGRLADVNTRGVAREVGIIRRGLQGYC